MSYADTVMPARFADYEMKIAQLLISHNSRLDKFGKTPEPMDRTKAVISYLKIIFMKPLPQAT